jgi:two-component system sensor histidine kinase UhpB
MSQTMQILTGREQVPSPPRGSGARAGASSTPARPQVRAARLVDATHVARAALTALLYYAGGQIDQLMGTSTSPAALWPPNAVLLTALLFAPTRVWWIYLLAVLPADRAISWPLPVRFGAGLYASNTLQTLLAASLIRLTWRAHPEWRQFRFLLHFTPFAVVVAPLTAALLGGATVHGFQPGTPYWTCWSRWFVANALTNLTLVPALSLAVYGLSAARPRHWSPPRVLEAVFTFTGLLLAAVAVFERSHVPSETVGALLYVPLPFVLWLAVRFGPGGVSAAQVLVVFVSLHGIANGRGPFVTGSPAANVLQIQLYLLAMSLPLLFLAAAVWERGQAVAALAISEREQRRARRRLAQSTSRVRELAGRLITAQEAERSRIARELHDDLSQRLAAISMGLSALKRHTQQGDGQKDLARLQRGAIELAAEVRSLSHELHPGILRHAGLAAALKATCRELDGRNGLAVTFAAPPAGDDGVPQLPQNVTICLYRVAQEALRNIARHARATRAAVILRPDHDALNLVVCDDGCGFDAAAARSSPGVGLASMEERVRLVHGSIEIDTHPGRGTELRVSVPLRRHLPTPKATARAGS